MTPPLSRAALGIVFAASLLCALPATAASIFSANFNTEVPALNTVPTGWAVTNGTVDIIGSGPNGTFADLLPGNGYYVDLDGSTSDAGVLTRSGLSFVAGTLYNLSFSLAGSQRGDTNTVTVTVDVGNGGVGDVTVPFTLSSAATFSTHTVPFLALVTTSAGAIIFDHAGGDNLGLLLDNVDVSSVAAAIPEPSTYALMLAGLGFIGFVAHRRRKAPTA